MPSTEGKTIVGWGVVRKQSEPWHFAGLFPTKEAAEAEAAKLGPTYVVLFGENRKGSDDFISSETTNAHRT